MRKTTPAHAGTRSTSTVTIRDVAAQAGVSVATVSRVINGKGQVGPEARRRVEDALRSLDYVPDAQARALSSHSSRAIGAVIPSIRNLNFSIFVGALQSALASSDYTLLFVSSEYDLEAELDAVRDLVTQGVAGIVLVGQVHHPDLYPLLERAGLPFITTWTLNSTGHPPCVGVDNGAAATRLTRYLLDLGHREFGVIASLSEGNDRTGQRIAGIRDTLRAAHVVLPEWRLVEGAGTISEGRQAMRSMLAQSPRPTAVLCINDFLAFGAMRECHEQGVPVPLEMSIAGFGNLEFASELDPALTTVELPAVEIAALTSETLLRAIHGPDLAEVLEVHAELIVRMSTARAPEPSSR